MKTKVYCDTCIWIYIVEQKMNEISFKNYDLVPSLLNLHEILLSYRMINNNRLTSVKVLSYILKKENIILSYPWNYIQDKEEESLDLMISIAKEIIEKSNEGLFLNYNYKTTVISTFEEMVSQFVTEFNRWIIEIKNKVGVGKNLSNNIEQKIVIDVSRSFILRLFESFKVNDINSISFSIIQRNKLFLGIVESFIRKTVRIGKKMTNADFYDILHLLYCNDELKYFTCENKLIEYASENDQLNCFYTDLLKFCPNYSSLKYFVKN